jgi:lipoprotein-anchoring transpeptidase ErfK/SrfK
MRQRGFFLLISFAFISLRVVFADTITEHSILISVADQKLVLLHGAAREAEYSVSTSKYGVGDRKGSYATPVGVLAVSEKIGASLPNGAVLKSRRPTGEIVRPNATGRDAILSRIIWLSGLQGANRNAHERGIYIHGTPEERKIGRPVSYGCIRMRSRDVIRLFDEVPVGAKIEITTMPVHLALNLLSTVAATRQ